MSHYGGKCRAQSRAENRGMSCLQFPGEGNTPTHNRYILQLEVIAILLEFRMFEVGKKRGT